MKASDTSNWKEIDINTWERKSHYDWFSSFPDPSVCVDVKLKITPVLKLCEKLKNTNGPISSFALLMYIITNAIHSVPAFRLRLKDGKIYEIDKTDVGYTVICGEHSFINLHAHVNQSVKDFLNQVEDNKNNYMKMKIFNDTNKVDDIYCSCVPWFSFLSVKQPIPVQCPDNLCIPRANWCKYYYENGEAYTTLNLTGSHAFVDGKDIADVISEAERLIATVEDWF